jgi:hypothetical protein
MSSLSARRGSKAQSPVASLRTGTQTQAPTALRDIVLGVVHSLDATGQPLVDFPGNPRGAPVQALTTGTHDDAIVGRTVALAFLGGLEHLAGVIHGNGQRVIRLKAVGHLPPVNSISKLLQGGAKVGFRHGLWWWW